MIKPVTLILILLFLSFVFTVQAQIEDSLVIENDIGLYKYSHIDSPPLEHNMERAQFAVYNLTNIENNTVTGVSFIVIKFKKLAYVEETFNKVRVWISQGNTVNILEEKYKGNIIYLGKTREQIDTRFWQSGLYVIVIGGPITYDLSTKNTVDNTQLYSPPKSLPEELLDAYLEKYPVNYLTCPPYQIPPEDGNQYDPEFDENGCISEYTIREDYHEEPNEIDETPNLQTESKILTPQPEPSYSSYPTPSYTIQSSPELPIPEPSQTQIPISGNIVKIENDQGKIIQAAVQLANVKVLLQGLKDNIEDVANFYYNSGNTEKYDLWVAVVDMFEITVNHINEIVQELKTTKDVKLVRNKIKELKDYVSQISVRILDAI